MNVDLEKVARDVASGVITETDGTRTITEFVYRNKYYFGLEKLSLDDLHDYIITCMAVIRHALKAYDPNMGPFTNLLQKSLRCHIFNWKKKKARDEMYDQSMLREGAAYLEEEHKERYALEEAECMAVEEASRQEAIDRVSPQSTDARPRPRARKAQLQHKDRKLLRTGALILALKSSYYMDDDTAQNVCNLTGIARDRLEEYREQVSSKMKGRIERRAKLQERRDNAYFHHRIYHEQLMSFDRDELVMQAINRRYKKSTDSWKQKNIALCSSKYHIVPTNTMVAQVLGISVRSVTPLMHRFYRNVDNLGIKRYDCTHENLSCNRKPQQKTGDGAAVPGTHSGDPQGRGD